MSSSLPKVSSREPDRSDVGHGRVRIVVPSCSLGGARAALFPSAAWRLVTPSLRKTERRVAIGSLADPAQHSCQVDKAVHQDLDDKALALDPAAPTIMPAVRIRRRWHSYI